MKNIKLYFIEKTLKEYMAEVSKRMIIAGKKMKVEDTGAGLSSISSAVIPRGDSASASMNFKEYLRFIDMGVSRKHPLGGLKSISTQLASRNYHGLRSVKDNTRKPKKLYSKVAYGQLTPMYNRLIYGFTEETITSLKQEIANNNKIQLRP